MTIGYIFFYLLVVALSLRATPVESASSTFWNSVKRVSQSDAETYNAYAAKVTFGASATIVKVDFAFEIGGDDALALGKTSNRDSVQAYHEIYRYGQCSSNNTSAAYHFALSSVLPDDDNRTASYETTITIDKSTHPELWNTFGGDSYVDFCYKVSLVPSTSDNTTIDSYEADVRVRIPDTYDADFLLANSVVTSNSTSHREYVSMDLAYTVNACLCGRLTGGYYDCVDSTQAYRLGTAVRICAEPGGVVNKNDTASWNPSTNELIDIKEVTELVLTQSTGVVGSNNGVNIVAGGSFRKAVLAGQPDSISEVEYVHAEAEGSGGTRRFKVVSSSSNATRRIAVMQTALNAEFFYYPSLPLSVDGLIVIEAKNGTRRRLLPQDVDGTGHVVPTATTVDSKKETIEATAVFGAGDRSSDGARVFGSVGSPIASSFGMMLNLDESDKVDQFPPPPPSNAPKAVLVGMVTGIVVSLLGMHTMLYLLGFRISFVRGTALPQYSRRDFQYRGSSRSFEKDCGEDEDEDVVGKTLPELSPRSIV